ncbi:hypothetical protein AMTRI_Chr06g192240 [Amborella trichopoda]
MAGKQANPLSSEAHPLLITHKSFLISQIIVRSIAAITSLSATILMVTDKQSISLFGLPITAKYTYAPAFRFFTASNSIAFAYSVLSLTYLLLKKAQGSGQKIGFFVFLLDLVQQQWHGWGNTGTLILGGSPFVAPSKASASVLLSLSPSHTYPSSLSFSSSFSLVTKTRNNRMLHQTIYVSHLYLMKEILRDRRIKDYL